MFFKIRTYKGWYSDISAKQQTTVSKQILVDWYDRQTTSFFQNIVLSFWVLSYGPNRGQKSQNRPNHSSHKNKKDLSPFYHKNILHSVSIIYIHFLSKIFCIIKWTSAFFCFMNLFDEGLSWWPLVRSLFSILAKKATCKTCHIDLNSDPSQSLR